MSDDGLPEDLAVEPLVRDWLSRKRKPQTPIRPPEWLSLTQRQIYKKLRQGRSLDAVAEGLLVAYVIAYDLHRQAARALGKEGALVPRGKDGAMIASPWLAVLEGQAVQMLKLQAALAGQNGEAEATGGMPDAETLARVEALLGVR